MSDTNTGASPVEGGEKKRIVVLVRREDTAEGASQVSKRRGLIISIGAVFLLLLGLGLGYRGAEVLLPHPERPLAESTPLTERVNGGLYALELAKPEGQARWMLEFDAEITTRDGPRNPLELRDALEKLVIASTSLPLVQTSTEPEIEMRKAMLTMAEQDFPWLVDVHMRRSDIRAKEGNRLQSLGDAMRALNAD